ncbi:MAG: flagellar hook-length control protein FliK [Clostridia bacterium]|nr:flagellar hook-length control protein FliK [Clostridia bacterium]
MNIGELKLQNVFANSQLQLNNDWLVSKKSSSEFKDVLESKTAQNSDVDPKSKYKGLNNDTMNHYAKDKINVREHTDQRRDLNELKEAIREKIAQNKLQKETDNDQPVQSLDGRSNLLEKLQEKIEDLEQMIKEELGIPDDIDALELLASLMDISVEQLMLQLTTSNDVEMDMDQLVEQLTDLFASEEVNTMKLVENLKTLVEMMPEDKADMFKEVLTEVQRQLESPEAKEAVQQILDFKPVEAEKVVVETPVSEVVTEEVKTEVAKMAEPVVEEVVPKEEVLETDKKVEAKEESSNTSLALDSDEDSTLEVSKVTETEGEDFDIEEQINLMKNETAVISSGKIEPKGVVGRSIMNQVIQSTKMSVNLSDQGSEILIKLNPKNLGNVALKMSFDKGVLLAEIQVENQAVKGVIQSNIADLRNALKQEGYIVGNLDVSVNQGDKENQEQQFTQHFKRQIFLDPTDDVEETFQTVVSNSEQVIDYLA